MLAIIETVVKNSNAISFEAKTRKHHRMKKRKSLSLRLPLLLKMLLKVVAKVKQEKTTMPLRQAELFVVRGSTLEVTEEIFSCQSANDRANVLIRCIWGYCD